MVIEREPDEALRLVFDRTYAHFWAAELGGERLEADLARIRAACRLRRGMAVLDLGCAHGRIANQLAADGLAVTAFDQSADLLALARAAAPDPPPEFVHGDMRALDMTGRFDVVLLWFSTFGYFADNENFAVLERVLYSLRPGGSLVIETRNWDRIYRNFDRWSVRVNGDDLLVERHDFIPATGRQQTEQFLIVGDSRYQRSYFLRRYSCAELTAMLRGAGFAAVDVYGEDLAPLSVEHERLIAVARKGTA
jgi:2-polyprenyl-3-methyl-5-hydroxy-6-metoxy-1,4-benzoquinol methylase